MSKHATLAVNVCKDTLITEQEAVRVQVPYIRLQHLKFYRHKVSKSAGASEIRSLKYLTVVTCTLLQNGVGVKKRR